MAPLNDLESWALSLFVAVGGEHWQEKLQLGGMTAILAISIFIIVVALNLRRTRNT